MENLTFYRQNKLFNTLFSEQNELFEDKMNLSDKMNSFRTK